MRKKIVFAISLKAMSDMLYLIEGALFDNVSQGSISCEGWCACNIHCDNNINIDNLINQFTASFDKYMLDGDKFIAEDKNVLFAEMMSGIIFEDPDDAICKYAEQKNYIITVV